MTFELAEVIGLEGRGQALVELDALTVVPDAFTVLLVGAITKETIRVDCPRMARNKAVGPFRVKSLRASATVSGEIVRGAGLTATEPAVGPPATKLVMSRLVQIPARPAANVRLTVQPFPC